MSRSIGKVFGTGPYLTSGFDTNTDFAGRDVGKMTTEELQRRIAEMFPQASVPQQIQDFAATNTTGINLQNNLPELTQQKVLGDIPITRNHQCTNKWENRIVSNKSKHIN